MNLNDEPSGEMLEWIISCMVFLICVWFITVVIGYGGIHSAV